MMTASELLTTALVVAQPTPSDPTQAMIMKYMPIFFGLIMFQLPAGLVVYILVNTALSIGQQYYIKKKFAKRNEAKSK